MEDNNMSKHRRSFGENMSSAEEANDIRYYRNRFEKALDSKNYGILRELIEEGRRCNYPIPSVSGDTTAMDIAAEAFMTDFRTAELRRNHSKIVRLFQESIRDGYPIPAPTTPVVRSLIIGLMSATK